MGYYHDHYLKTDVVQLVDMLKEFRNVCHENYELHPTWYFTAPGLAWHAVLKETKVELELLSDVGMLLMIGNGVRGGISMISNRFGRANSKYIDEAYDETKLTKYITYLNANNLYGWAMCLLFPVRGFKWMQRSCPAEGFTDFDNLQDISCILEGDVVK